MISDFSTNPVTSIAGTLSASISNGTFYNGKYYYIGHLTDDLYEVTFDSDGYVDTETKLADFTANTKQFYFGDIAYSSDGVLYGSVSYGSTKEFFSYDGTNYTPLTNTGAPEALQIAFGNDGVLYGYAIGNNKFYIIDTSNGTLTEKCNSTIDFSDLASGPPEMYSLCASQSTAVGYVQVWNDIENLYVKYQITDPDTCLIETHLQVAYDLTNIPQTKKGNPIPGQFDNSMEHSCVRDYTYTVALGDWGQNETLTIAAHAVVQMPSIDSSGACASDFFDFSQGFMNNGEPVFTRTFTDDCDATCRINPANAYGEPDGIVGPHDTFFSLGLGGYLILTFPSFVGGELTVYETSWGGLALEKAEVYASRDGADWTLLGEAVSDSDAENCASYPNTFTLDECIQYVKIVDTTDKNLFASPFVLCDGFDVDAVCTTSICEEETAWGDGNGCETEGPSFPGKNWATYLEYTVQ